MRRSVSRLASYPLLGLFAAVLLGCFEGTKTEDPVTKAIVEDVFNFGAGELAGFVNTPVYPIAVPYTFYDTTYAAIVTAASSAKDPLGFLQAVFFPGVGPLPAGCGVTNCTNGTNHIYAAWQFDPAGWKVSNPSGNYTVGRSGPDASRQDYLDVYGQFYYQGAAWNYLGEAVLPWRFSYAAVSMAGSSNAVFPNEGFWLQAFAALPSPISYAWMVDGVVQSWNTAFINTSLTGHGEHTITATLTGSNSAAAEVSWIVFVKCPPPDAPFADECGTPP